MLANFRSQKKKPIPDPSAANIRNAFRPDGSPIGPLTMVSLSEYRRKRNLARNVQIDKRCARKLELSLGWADQTEVFGLLIQFINFCRRNIWRRYQRHTGVSEILLLPSLRATSKQMQNLFFLPQIPSRLYHHSDQRVQAEAFLAIVNVTVVVVAFMLIGHSRGAKRTSSGRLNSRGCWKTRFWGNGGDLTHACGKMRGASSWMNSILSMAARLFLLICSQVSYRARLVPPPPRNSVTNVSRLSSGSMSSPLISRLQVNSPTTTRPSLPSQAPK
jgi:hypothetical protein